MKLIKCYPIAMNVYILAIMALYAFFGIGYVSQYAYPVIGQSLVLNVILLYFSFKFSFCFWHRLLIYNMTFCLMLEAISNFGITFSNHAYIVIVVTMLNIIATWLIYRKHGCFNKNKACRHFKNAD